MNMNLGKQGQLYMLPMHMAPFRFTISTAFTGTSSQENGTAYASYASISVFDAYSVAGERTGYTYGYRTHRDAAGRGGESTTTG